MSTEARMAERTAEDLQSDKRAATTADLIRVGAEHREGELHVPEAVQNRIKKVGDIVYAKLSATDSESIERTLAARIAEYFADRPLLDLTPKDCEVILSILRSLGAVDLGRVERRLPKEGGIRAGWLGYSNWSELVRA